MVKQEVEMLKELEHKEPHGELQGPAPTESSGSDTRGAQVSRRR